MGSGFGLECGVEIEIWGRDVRFGIWGQRCAVGSGVEIRNGDLGFGHRVGIRGWDLESGFGVEIWGQDMGLGFGVGM